MPKRRTKKGLARIGLIGGGIALGSFAGTTLAFADASTNTAATTPTSTPVGAPTAMPAGTGTANPTAPMVADGLVEPDGSLWTTSGHWAPMPKMAAEMVGWTARPGGGAWEVNAHGAVVSRGNAPFYGSLVGRKVSSEVVAIAATPTGAGYWLVTATGGVFTFGDATFAGAATGYRPSSPIVGIAVTPTGAGYWLATAAGGIYAFGDAAFHGSLAGHAPSKAVVGIAPTPAGSGYWLLSAGGGVFAFGDAAYAGSTTGKSPLPTVAITADDGGYDLIRIDGRMDRFRPRSQPTTGSVALPRVEVAAAEAAYTPVPMTHEAKVRAEAVSAAYSELGKPYVYGAAGPGAFDCSGLVSFVYAHAGVSVPRNSVQQFQLTSHVSAAQLQPGDLVFFYPGVTHVGIYVGNGQMIDAPHTGARVRIESVRWFGPLVGASDPAV